MLLTPPCKVSPRPWNRESVKPQRPAGPLTKKKNAPMPCVPPSFISAHRSLISFTTHAIVFACARCPPRPRSMGDLWASTLHRDVCDKEFYVRARNTVRVTHVHARLRVFASSRTKRARTPHRPPPLPPHPPRRRRSSTDTSRGRGRGCTRAPESHRHRRQAAPLRASSPSPWPRRPRARARALPIHSRAATRTAPGLCCRSTFCA